MRQALLDEAYDKLRERLEPAEGMWHDNDCAYRCLKQDCNASHECDTCLEDDLEEK